MLIGLIMLAVVMWILQTILAVRQFNQFNRHIKELRKSGKVAIGKAKGKLRAGAIVMFLIDDNLKITVKGSKTAWDCGVVPTPETASEFFEGIKPEIEDREVQL